MAETATYTTGKGRTALTAPAPIKVAKTWLAEISPTDDFPLIDVSQAAPTAPTHPDMLAHMADLVANNPAVHQYGAILGLDRLREALADHWSEDYGTAAVAHENIAITSGCNQAFCAVISAIASKGDEIIIPSPWYFNHKMWLDMSEITTTALVLEETLIPDASVAADLITPETRAICLVSPNNPTGVEYPRATITAFYQLAKSHGIKLILDETYKDFRSYEGAPHDLMQRDDVFDTLIQLYSFSKAYRLTGHRVGAIIGHPDLLAEVEKFLDTVTICPTLLGQEAALFGVQHLTDWVNEERLATLKKQAQFRSLFAALEPQGWSLLGCGAYFAYVAYPYDMDALSFCKHLVHDQHILALPCDMFLPPDQHGTERHLRIAFANIDEKQMQILIERLTNLPYRLAPIEKGA